MVTRIIEVLAVFTTGVISSLGYGGVPMPNSIKDWSETPFSA